MSVADRIPLQSRGDRLREGIAKLTGARRPPPVMQQGDHIDPDAPGAQPPDRTWWAADLKAAYASPQMEAFRRGLRLGDRPIRESVVDDLATYHDIDAAEAVERCLNWEALSVKEWSAEDRADPDGLLRFYRTMQSWSFDLLWYAYLQAEGHHTPVSVAALRWLQNRSVSRRHLDFGSGIGATSQLFLDQGWSSTLGDVSSTLLDFARFRMDRRDQHPTYVDLAVESLPTAAFDAVTAIDTLAHVPDLDATARDLHRVIAPGGHLLANIDARPPSPENAWHLYDDEHGARYTLQRVGFRPVGTAGGLVAYLRVDPADPMERARRPYQWATLASPGSRAVREARRRTAPVVRSLLERRGAR